MIKCSLSCVECQLADQIRSEYVCMDSKKIPTSKLNERSIF